MVKSHKKPQKSQKQPNLFTRIIKTLANLLLFSATILAAATIIIPIHSLLNPTSPTSPIPPSPEPPPANTSPIIPLPSDPPSVAIYIFISLAIIAALAVALFFTARFFSRAVEKILTKLATRLKIRLLTVELAATLFLWTIPTFATAIVYPALLPIPLALLPLNLLLYLLAK
jgi:hypothetical protein